MRILSHLLLVMILGIIMTGCHPKIAQSPFTNFDNPELPSAPHYCLACPNCSGKRHIKTSTYPLSAEQLKQHWQTMIHDQPRTQKASDQGFKQRYIQRTAVFQFPDVIDVQFKPVDHQHSQLYILSQSVYGYYDFGKNCHRVKTWLNQLHQQLTNHS